MASSFLISFLCGEEKHHANQILASPKSCESLGNSEPDNCDSENISDWSPESAYQKPSSERLLNPSAGSSGGMSTEKSETQQADVSRRRFLKIGAGVVVVAAAGAAGYYYLTQPPSGPPATTSMTEATTSAPPTTSAMVTPEQIEWGIWSWGVELVQDNARIFMEGNPDITVKIDDYGLDTFGSGVATAYAGGKPADMHYSTPDITIVYQASKQTYDMETNYPEILKYNDDIYPGYRTGLVNPYTGKMYGLFYYSGGQTFAYNKRHYDSCRYRRPTTEDHGRTQSKCAEDKGEER